MLAARHNVESPVVSPQKAVDRGEASIAAAWRSRAEAAERAAYELQAQVEQLRAAGVGTPSSAVAQDVVVRMRARAWHHLQRAVLGWRKRSLLQACAMWRAWTLQLAAGVALPRAAPRWRRRSAATRGVQSAEAHARARRRAAARGRPARPASRRRGRRRSRATRRPPRTTTPSRRARRGGAATWSRAAEGSGRGGAATGARVDQRPPPPAAHHAPPRHRRPSLAAAVTRRRARRNGGAAKWRRSVLLLQLGLAR